MQRRHILSLGVSLLVDFDEFLEGLGGERVGVLVGVDEDAEFAEVGLGLLLSELEEQFAEDRRGQEEQLVDPEVLIEGLLQQLGVQAVEYLVDELVQVDAGHALDLPVDQVELGLEYAVEWLCRAALRGAQAVGFYVAPQGLIKQLVLAFTACYLAFAGGAVLTQLRLEFLFVLETFWTPFIHFPLL